MFRSRVQLWPGRRKDSKIFVIQEVEVGTGQYQQQKRQGKE